MYIYIHNKSYGNVECVLKYARTKQEWIWPQKFWGLKRLTYPPWAVGAVVFTTQAETMSDHIVFNYIQYQWHRFVPGSTNVPGSTACSFPQSLNCSCSHSPSGDHQVSEYIRQTLSHFSSGAARTLNPNSNHHSCGLVN